MTIKIIGQRRLARKLNKLPIVARTLIRRAIEISAEEMVALMKSLVPVSPGGGTLRDSIGWTFGKPPAGSITVTELVSIDKTLTATLFAGSALDRSERKGAFYARWQEHGTIAFPASPYFFVSYRALRARTRRRISRSINKAAKVVARA